MVKYFCGKAIWYWPCCYHNLSFSRALSLFYKFCFERKGKNWIFENYTNNEGIRWMTVILEKAKKCIKRNHFPKKLAFNLRMNLFEQAWAANLKSVVKRFWQKKQKNYVNKNAPFDCLDNCDCKGSFWWSTCHSRILWKDSGWFSRLTVESVGFLLDFHDKCL